ncbi:peptidoglycan-binding domain-containing protein [Actinoplanes sp. NPDC023714]|uniref:peptidoglycan-binding domain-containing protein n=1 Tax=Actinoplanes sp. NPDC023714 TaxID=3154322 RepID=UPI0033CE2D5A
MADILATDRDLDALRSYLAVAPERFAAHQDRYFDRLGELLVFHRVVGDRRDVHAGTFRQAVRHFQSAAGLAADGIPGEDTAWELNRGWAESRRLPTVVVEMDQWTPPGVPHHDPDDHGYSSMRVRSDVAGAARGMRAELNEAGVLMTTAGALRPLDAVVSSGRKPTSIHYCGAAFDLSTTSGMVRSARADARNQLYVITASGDRWNVWARSDRGVQRDLDAVEWHNGSTSVRPVSGRFLDVTAVAARHGFHPIGPRSEFPAKYGNAEWWHFQNHPVLVPWISQFGPEILALTTIDEADLQERPRLWAECRRLFQRGRNGWW